MQADEVKRLLAMRECERRELDALVAEQARIGGEIRDRKGALRMLDAVLGMSGSGSQTASAPSSRSLTGSGGPKAGSRVARAHEFLKSAGKSMHVRDILTGIGEVDTERMRNSMTTQITRYIESGRLFFRDEAMGARCFGVLDGDGDGEGEDDRTPEGDGQ